MYCQWMRILLLLQFGFFVYCQSQYSIVAPGVVRSNRKYSVSVSLHNATRTATVRVGIRQYLTTIILDSQEVTLQPFETKLMDLHPPKLFNRFKYELWAEGVEGIQLNETYQLNTFEGGGLRIYIESDKATYKSEDVVHFRVIVLDEHLRQIKIKEPIKVQILDPESNRVKQFKDIELSRGVFADQFQLSKYPLLGEWTIRVFVSGKYDMEEKKTFTVAEYVLPKFTVQIVTNPHIVPGDSTIEGFVFGRYTYGRYVEGTVVVSLFGDMIDNLGAQTLDINNEDIKAAFTFEIGHSKLESLSTIRLEAILKEKYTNESMTAFAFIDVHKESYKIEIPTNEIEFRNKQPHRLKATVLHWNNSKVVDSETPVMLQLRSHSYSSALNENGTAVFEIEPDSNSDMKISYKDSSKKINILGDDNYYATPNGLEGKCRLQMKSKSFSGFPKLVEILVSSDHDIPYLMYTITSHANIVHSEVVADLSSNQKTCTIQIRPTIAMIPCSYIYVYYIVDQQWKYCETSIDLPNIFENKISISAPTQAQPGENITLNIRSQPDSHLSLVAVDIGVLLLDSKNVLRKEKIMKDLVFDKSYLSTPYIQYPGLLSGLVTLTNALKEAKAWDGIKGDNGKIDRKIGLRIDQTIEGFAVWEPPIRSKFPETWLVKDIEVTSETTTLMLEIPDTITTWVIRAFSVNDHSGFGMLEEPLHIEVFQPFFVSLSLPYSVKLGEILQIPIQIFNYLHEDLQTSVNMLNNNGDFHFVDNMGKSLIDMREDTREITIPGRSGRSIIYSISPQRLGDIDIQVSAINNITADRILRKLKVEPEGIAQNVNTIELISLNEGSRKEIRFPLHVPSGIVPDSEYITLAVGGDVMADALDNLDNLVNKPKGCGEQNMITLAPNILIMEYLNDLEQMPNETTLEDKALKYIELGYQQQLMYRHSSGAFSVFGPKSGSIENNWLTAYVIRFFIKGMKYIAIDTKVIDSGLDYLANQQLEDGCFPQRGYLFYPAHQNRYGFTAFVLLTFYEHPKYARKYNIVIQKALKFLTDNIDNVDDVYALAIMANVLILSGDERVNAIISRLNLKAIVEGDRKWWSSNRKGVMGANAVEITSYVLMALLETPGDYWSIFRWLMDQRNNHGGFRSTHDTVVGLQALMKFMRKSADIAPDIAVKIEYEALDANSQLIDEGVLGIDEDNYLILQKHELPSTARWIVVKLIGHGSVFLEISYQYYLPTVQRRNLKLLKEPAPRIAPAPTNANKTDTVPSPAPGNATAVNSARLHHKYFTIEPTAKMTFPNQMSLNVCFSYQPKSEEGYQSNMVIMKVQFPSGFVLNAKNRLSLLKNDLISRIEPRQSAAKICIYFEKLEAETQDCISMVGNRRQEVSSMKPSLIEMYDFYNTKRHSEISYEIQN